MIAMASEGLAEYLWSGVAEEEESAVDAGARRLAQNGAPFSFENCFVADHEERAIGVLHAYPAANPEHAQFSGDPVLVPFFELRDVGSLYVSALVVAPDHRGGGVGGQLLHTAERIARSRHLPRLSLIVLEHNATAMRFYHRRGFREAGRRPLVARPAVPHWRGDAVLLIRPLVVGRGIKPSS
jgi:GNAT superfamily N-acetyltransferase